MGGSAGGDSVAGNPSAAGGAAGDADAHGGAGASQGGGAADGNAGAAGDGGDCSLSPVDVLVLLDRSASMLEPPTLPDGTLGITSKWELLVPPLLSALEASPSSIRWGLKVFPEGDLMECAAGSVTDHVYVPFGAASAVIDAIQTTTPNGNGTPTGDAVQRAAEYLAAMNDDRPKFILLVTDGHPSCAGVTATEPGMQGADMAQAYAVGTLMAAHLSGFSSFVVAVGTNAQSERSALNAMAGASGRPAPALHPLDTLFYLGNNDEEIAAALADALAGASACPAPPQPALALPYVEDFEDGVADGFIVNPEDAALAGVAWSVIAEGENSVYAPEQAYADPTLVIGGDRRWNDVRVSARVTFAGAQSDEGSVTLVARYRENGAGYFLEYEAAGYVRLRTRSGDFTTDLVPRTQVPPAGATAHELSLVAHGGDLSIFVDGVLVASATDSTPLPPGGIALGAVESTPRFDDLRVSAP
jgi:hypothetical protein